MSYGGSDAHGAQRSAFSRLMAARRTSDGPSTQGVAAHAGRGKKEAPAPPTTSSKNTTTSSLRLPNIGRSNGTHPGATSLTLSSQLFNGSSGSGGGGANTVSASPGPSAPSVVIHERTPRAELLAIITQLQFDLSQRTDSVNAIQRNFQRLSAMHHAEQEELQRLRLLQQEWQNTQQHSQSNDVEKLAQRQLIEQLQNEVKEQQENYARLQEETAQSHDEHQRAMQLNDSIRLYFSERQRVEYDEAAAYAVLSQAIAVEQTRLVGRLERAKEQQHFRRQLQHLIESHVGHVAALTRGVDARKVNEVADEASFSSSHGKANVAFAADVTASIAAKLKGAEDLVEKCVTACDVASTAQHTAVVAAAQQEVEEAHAKAVKLQAMLRAALTQSEQEQRSVLECTADESFQYSMMAFQNLAIAHKKEIQSRVEAQSHMHDAVQKGNTHMTAWCATAEQRMAEFCTRIDDWCAQYAADLTAQRALLAQHGHAASELAAAQTEWAALRDTELKAHRAELTRVRQDAAGKVATLELKINAAQQRCTALQSDLDAVRAAQAAAVAAAEATLQSKVAAATAEREALLSRQWHRVQSAQAAQTSATVALLWSTATQREACAVEEAAARRELYHSCEAAMAQTSQRAQTMQRHASSMKLLWATRATHVMENETAARALVAAEAEGKVEVLLAEEAGARAQLHHTHLCHELERKLDGAESRLSEAEVEHRQQTEQLATEVRFAQQELQAAQRKASAAVAAAQAARDDAESTRAALHAFKAATAAAAQRIEAAESATESACCCPICLQLLYKPVACVPCGHVYCAGCLLTHGRNKALSSRTANTATTGAPPSSSSSLPRRVSGFGAARVEVEVAQWMDGLTTPHARLFCPECGTASVSAVVELCAVGELTAKYAYKKSALMELMRDLDV